MKPYSNGFGHVERMEEKRLPNAALHGHVREDRSWGNKGRGGWTMLGKTWKREAFNYLQHMEKPRIEKSGVAKWTVWEVVSSGFVVWPGHGRPQEAEQWTPGSTCKDQGPSEGLRIAAVHPRGGRRPISEPHFRSSGECLCGWSQSSESWRGMHKCLLLYRPMYAAMCAQIHLYMRAWMNICRLVCVSMYICMYLWIYACLYGCMHECMYVYLCLCVCTNTCTYAFMYEYNVRLHVSMYECIYIYVCNCVCLYVRM